MSVYTKMAQEECLTTIRKYDNDELIKFITKHGYGEFCDVLKTREITGDQFLSLKEYEVVRWKLTITQRRKLWSFIYKVQEQPEQFFPAKKLEPKQPKIVKKTNTQHQNTKDKLEQVIGMKTPEQTLKRPEVTTLPKRPKKPLPEPPPSPSAHDYLVMEKPLPPLPSPPPFESHYDNNGYLLPVQRTPEVEEANYGSLPDPPPLLPSRTAISDRKPLALPRDIPLESPKLLPRIINKSTIPPPEKKIVISQKKQVFPDEENETYETAPNIPESVFKSEESEEEDATYEPVPNSPKTKKEETSKSSLTKFLKNFVNPFGKKTETMTKKSSKEENDFRPLPPLPAVPAILTPCDDEGSDVYENTEDVKNGTRSPSPNVIYTNTGVEVVSSGTLKSEKVTKVRRKSEGKGSSFQRNALLSASLRTLPGTSPPKRIMQERFSPPRSSPIPIRAPSPEIIYTNEGIQESLERDSRRIPNSNLSPTPDETPPRTDSPDALYLNTETEKTRTRSPVVQRSNTPPISKMERSPSSLPRKAKLPPGPYEHYFGSNMKPLPRPPNTPPQLLLDPKEVLETCNSDSEGEYQQPTFNLNNERFYRTTDRKGAKLLLSDLEDGAFLFRPSKKFYLSLSVKQDGKYYNLGIDRTENNKIRLNTVNDDLSPEFATPDELASYFTREELRFTSDGNMIRMFLKKILPSDVF